MGRYSVVIEGQVLDIAFREKRSLGGGTNYYQVYIGDHRIGAVYAPLHSWNGWSAQCYEPLKDKTKAPRFPTMVEGFKSRYYAGEYVIARYRHNLKKASREA